MGRSPDRETGPCDCNHNGIDDAVDISSGTSQDTNGNGVPDECEGSEVAVRLADQHGFHSLGAPSAPDPEPPFCSVQDRQVVLP